MPNEVCRVTTPLGFSIEENAFNDLAFMGSPGEVSELQIKSCIPKMNIWMMKNKGFFYSKEFHFGLHTNNTNE